MTVFMKKQEKTNKNLKLTFINYLILNNDVTSLESLKSTLEYFNQYGTDYLYSYDDISCSKCINCKNNDFYDCNHYYNSDIEYFLTELNNVGYPIGYTKDILIDCMALKYTKDSLMALDSINDVALLELFNIGLFKCDLKALIGMFDIKLNAMALDYLKNTLESNINETEKIQYLIGTINAILDGI